MVKFKGEKAKKIIDWEKAKKHPLIFMEYFGARLTWPSSHEIIDPMDNTADSEEDQDDVYQKDIDAELGHDETNHAEPNDIEWEI